MISVDIRAATEADLGDILRAYSEAGIDGGLAFTIDEAREHFARLRAYPSYRVFVASLKGVFAGTYAYTATELAAVALFRWQRQLQFLPSRWPENAADGRDPNR